MGGEVGTLHKQPPPQVAKKPQSGGLGDRYDASGYMTTKSVAMQQQQQSQQGTLSNTGFAAGPKQPHAYDIPDSAPGSSPRGGAPPQVQAASSPRGVETHPQVISSSPRSEQTHPQVAGSSPGNTGTIKRAPPPPPKRKPEVTSSTSSPRDQHYAVSSVANASSAAKRLGYDTPNAPRPVAAVAPQAPAIANKSPAIANNPPANYPSNCYGTNIRGFVSDLSRVVDNKHTRFGQHVNMRTHSNQPASTVPGPNNTNAGFPQDQACGSNPASAGAPEPPPPRPEGVAPFFVPDDLPPPPAELLEELKILRKRSKPPPPPPKRTS